MSGGRGRCPICHRPTVERYRPFCSRRCADIDLARWLGGRYRIADSLAGDDDEWTGDARADEDDEEARGPSGRRH